MLKFLVIILILFIPIFCNAQYWGERATEKSYEHSELYFRSYYLNTFGLHRFRDIVVGMIKDPFLDLYLNPANLPKLDNNNLIYLDFRGDRTESAVIRDYTIYPLDYFFSYYPRYYVDPRWYTSTRREPEPVFSIGYLSYPLEISPQILFGATYQLIYKQEKYYSIPSWIYMNRYGYDAFNAQVVDEGDIPIKDREVGQDEMLNHGHLFSIFLGSQLVEKFSIGFSLNSIIHSREGIYADTRSDEYGNTDNSNWYYYKENSKDQNYDHYDLSLGLNYYFTHTFFSGIKIGYLGGDSKQTYQAIYSSKYQYQQIDEPSNWSRSMSESITNQSWDHDGENWYGSINLTKKTKQGHWMNIYYRYTEGNNNLQNNTEITDTSYYASHWTSDTEINEYRNSSSLSDIRAGSGKRTSNHHEAMLNMHMKLSKKSTVILGCYYFIRKSIISSTEPVIANRFSHYYSSGYYNRDVTKTLLEDKTLEWEYNSKEWSFQIPVFLDFQVSSYWSIMLGISRSLYSWHIKDETIAYFDIRRRTENDSIYTETNFGERYKEPDKKLSEEFTDIISKFSVKISSDFQIHLLINPEFKESFRIAQWWLGFQASL